MKSLVVFLALAATASARVSPGMSFDDIDLDKFETKEQIANFIKCMSDKNLIKECSDTVVNIRERGADIVENNCAQCTRKEKEAVAVLARKVGAQDEGASGLIELMKKYDRTGTKTKSFLEAANNFETKRKVPNIPEAVISKYDDLKDKHGEPENIETPTTPSHRSGFKKIAVEGGILAFLSLLLRGLFNVVDV